MLSDSPEIPATGLEWQWPDALHLQDLVEGALHLWRADLDALESCTEAFHSLLSMDERARACRITRQEQKRRFVAARAMLRMVLGRYLQIPPARIAFERGPHGKPRIAGSALDEGLVFNTSDTQNHWAVALGYDGRLGMDIECWRSLRDVEGFAAKSLGEVEQSYWNRLPSQQKLPELFRLWTLKESFCKAVGRGLGLGLRSCVFDCGAPKPRLIAVPGDADCGDPADWQFAELTERSGISGAIAWNRPIEVVRRYDVRNEPPLV